MGRWLDSFGAGVPVVEFEDDSGRRTAVPRDQATMFGFMPDAVADAAALAPPIEPTIPEVPLDVPPMSPPLPQGFAALRPALPEGGASAFGQGALAPDPQVGPAPAFIPPPMIAPEPQTAPTTADAPEPQGFTLPGVGYVPAASGGVDPANRPPPEVVASEPDPTRQSVLDGQGGIAQREADAAYAEIAKSTAAMDAAEAQRQKDLQEDAAELSRLDREYGAMIKKEADFKIEPNRKYHSMSTGKKVLGVISIVLSGLGSALKKQGDKNPALDILMNAFQEDIALQMDERAQLGRSVAAKRGQLDKFAEVAQTRDGVRLAKIATMATREARRLREISAKSATERVKFDMDSLALDLEGAAAAAAAQGQQAEFDNYLKAKEDSRKDRELAIKEAKAGGGGPGLAGKAGTGGSYASLDAIDPKFRDKAVRLPDGSWMITNSRESAKEATAAVVQSTAMVDTIDRALSKVTSMPGFSSKLAGKAGWESKDIQVINQEMSQLVMAAKEYYKLGVISGPDLELITALGADVKATSSFNEQQWSKLQNWRSGVTQDAASKLRAYGVDIDPGAAYGAAPEKPTPKPSGEWSAQITSSPTRGKDDAIVAVPTISDVEKSILGMRESFIAEGKSDGEWQGELGSMAARSRQEANAARGRIKDINAQIDKLEKKGGKEAAAKITALRQRKIEEAAAMAHYEGNSKRLLAAKGESIQDEIAKRKAATAKEKAERANKAKRDDFGSAGRNF